MIRWLVGLEPWEEIPEDMGQDMRSMWGRVRWLRELNEMDLDWFKEWQLEWQGWRWLVALKEGGYRV